MFPIMTKIAQLKIHEFLLSFSTSWFEMVGKCENDSRFPHFTISDSNCHPYTSYFRLPK